MTVIAVAGAAAVSTGAICGLVRAVVALRIARMACATFETAEVRDVTDVVVALLGLAGACAGAVRPHGASQAMSSE